MADYIVVHFSEQIKNGGQRMLINDKDPNSFYSQIKAKLNEGYKCVGGVFIKHYNDITDTTSYYQAMVKEANTEANNQKNNTTYGFGGGKPKRKRTQKKKRV